MRARSGRAPGFRPGAGAHRVQGHFTLCEDERLAGVLPSPSGRGALHLAWRSVICPWHRVAAALRGEDAGTTMRRHEEERHDPRPDHPRRPRLRRHGRRRLRGRRGGPRGPHRPRGRDRRGSARRARRPGPRRGSGLHRRAQPLGLHPAGGPAGGQRHPPGGDHGSDRQLRPRLLPDQGSRPVEPHRLRVRRHRAPGLVHPGRLPGAARAGRARRQRHDPGAQWPASPGHGRARFASRE